jgi:hypothetical protein
VLGVSSVQEIADSTLAQLAWKDLPVVSGYSGTIKLWKYKCVNGINQAWKATQTFANGLLTSYTDYVFDHNEGCCDCDDTATGSSSCCPNLDRNQARTATIISDGNFNNQTITLTYQGNLSGVDTWTGSMDMGGGCTAQLTLFCDTVTGHWDINFVECLPGGSPCNDIGAWLEGEVVCDPFSAQSNQFNWVPSGSCTGAETQTAFLVIT